MFYLWEQVGVVLFNMYLDIVFLLWVDISNEKVSLDELVLENIDYQIWMMEVLSFFCFNGIVDFFVEIFYLFLNQDKIMIWCEKFVFYMGFKIGFVWVGNFIYVNDVNCLVSLEEWKLFVELEGINWFFLQKGVGMLEVVYFLFGFVVIDFLEQIGDFLDIVVILVNFDLFISVDILVVYLVGVCDFLCWVLFLYKGKDWCWCNQGEILFWYLSIWVFILGENENWIDLFMWFVLLCLIEMGVCKWEMFVMLLFVVLD